MAHISVVTAFANVFVRLGVRHIFSELSDFSVVGEVDSRNDAFQLVVQRKPALLFLGSVIEGGSLQLIKDLHQSTISTKVVLFSDVVSNSCLEEMMELGLAGSIPQTSSFEFTKKILRKIAQNEHVFVLTELEKKNFPVGISIDINPLSAREWEVASILSTGKSNKEIAAALHVSYSTIKNHISNIYNKLLIRSRAELTSWVLSKKS